MKIELMEHTILPISAIAQAAGTSYGKRDTKEQRARNCIMAGHESVLEHAWFTVYIEGISRACSHQLVRHRMASFVQQSQRYCRIDTRSSDWYVMPPEEFGSWRSVEDMDADEFFEGCMMDAARNYQDALNAGIKPEDARYLLPEACKTNITMTMNARELFHFLDLRTDSAAQWEIRILASEIENVLRSASVQWNDLLEMRKECLER